MNARALQHEDLQRILSIRALTRHGGDKRAVRTAELVRECYARGFNLRLGARIIIPSALAARFKPHSAFWVCAFASRIYFIKSPERIIEAYELALAAAAREGPGEACMDRGVGAGPREEAV